MKWITEQNGIRVFAMEILNRSCPWSKKPIAEDATTAYRGYTVAFCNRGCRDEFASAIAAFELAKTNPWNGSTINAMCPWSGKPTASDATTRYLGQYIVGFCNTGCRDQFEKATALFDALIEKAE